MNTLPIAQSMTDGLILSLILSVVVIASLYYNPRIWLNDYPKEIQARVPPLSPIEKRQRLVAAGLTFGAGIAIMVYSTSRLEAQGASFLLIFLNAFIIFHIFNLFDAVILDYLLLTVMRPKFAFVPGIEGLEHLLFDRQWQIRNFLKGLVVCTLLALVTALIAAL